MELNEDSTVKNTDVDDFFIILIPALTLLF